MLPPASPGRKSKTAYSGRRDRKGCGRSRSRPARPAPPPVCRPATSCSRLTVSRSRRPRRSQGCSTGPAQARRLPTRVLASGTQSLRQLTLQPVPQGHRALYFLLAALATFTLLVGLSVRLRRPADQATLHFFWLSVALFGVLAFSFSGRWDRARSVLLLGRRHRHAAAARRCSCTSAWCSRSARRPGCDRPMARALAAVALSTGAAARRARASRASRTRKAAGRSSAA